MLIAPFLDDAGQWQIQAQVLWIMLLAFALDVALGDPPWLYRALPHPVVWIGRLIALTDLHLNRPAAGPRARFWLGLAATTLVVFLAVLAGWMIHWICGLLPHGWIVEGVLVASLLAYRGLYDHVKAVALGLDESLAEGRAAVAKIVGRDPESLDEPGVARAASESLAENFSDGVVAPLFWLALLGLPGLCAYKAVNTLDSMIGYRSERYLFFGRAAARLDDGVNWLPARLAGVLIVLAAFFLPGAAGRGAWRVMWRDAPKHRSPNAGWPEAALAGALGFALAGPRHYGSETVSDPWIGDGRAELSGRDLKDALRLYGVAGAVIGAVLVLGLLFWRP